MSDFVLKPNKMRRNNNNNNKQKKKENEKKQIKTKKQTTKLQQKLDEKNVKWSYRENLSHVNTPASS